MATLTGSEVSVPEPSPHGDLKAPYRFAIVPR